MIGEAGHVLADRKLVKDDKAAIRSTSKAGSTILQSIA